MPVLPGSRYIGPGNPLPNGDPTNDFDAIARDHDYEYQSASDASAIRSSDRRFLKRVLDTPANSVQQKIHKYLAVGGIAGKYAVESLSGVLYPSFQVCLVLQLM